MSENTPSPPSPQENETERLISRVKELELQLKKTRTAYSTAISDVFASFPARAASVESGAVSLVPAHAPKVEICFGRRFEIPPKVVCWVLVRGVKEEDELQVFTQRIKPNLVATTSRSATITLPQEIVNCSSDSKRQRIALYWFASVAPVANPKLSAALQKLFSCPSIVLTSQLEKELKAVISACPAGIDEADQIGQTLLHAASFSGCTELVSWLLDRGAQKDVTDGQGWTPLLAAIAAEKVSVAKLLLKKNASVHSTCERGQTCLHLLCRWPNNSETQESLIKDIINAGLSINSKNDVGETPLLYHLRKHISVCIPLAKLLLDLGADPSITDNAGIAPLHIAAETDNVTLAKMLINAGANTKVQGPNGTPLIVAMRKRAKNVLELFADGKPEASNPQLLSLVFRTMSPKELHHLMRVSKLFQKVALEISDDPTYWYSSCGASKEVYIPYCILMKGMKQKLEKYTTDIQHFNVALPPSPQAPLDQQPNEPVRRILIAVQGASAAGKSCFIMRFCDRVFNSEASTEMEQRLARRHHMQLAYKKAHATINSHRVEVVLAEVPPNSYQVIGNSELQTQQSDQQQMKPHQFFSIDTFWTSCSACAIILDTTRKDTVDNARQLIWQWRAKCRSDRIDNIVLIGTKSDIFHRGQVSNTTGVVALADDMQLLYVEASASNGKNVDEAIKAACEMASKSGISSSSLPIFEGVSSSVSGDEACLMM